VLRTDLEQRRDRAERKIIREMILHVGGGELHEIALLPVEVRAVSYPCSSIPGGMTTERDKDGDQEGNAHLGRTVYMEVGFQPETAKEVVDSNELSFGQAKGEAARCTQPVERHQAIDGKLQRQSLGHKAGDAALKSKRGVRDKLVWRLGTEDEALARGLVIYTVAYGKPCAPLDGEMDLDSGLVMVSGSRVDVVVLGVDRGGAKRIFEEGIPSRFALTKVGRGHGEACHAE